MLLSHEVESDFSVSPQTIACQASLSVGFPKQEYWNRLPFPSPGDLPGSGIKPPFPALAGGFFTTAPPGKPKYLLYIFAITILFVFKKVD